MSESGLVENYDAGSSGPTLCSSTQPFFSGELHLSVFLTRHLTLTTALRQSDWPNLSFIHKKLNDLFMTKGDFLVRKKKCESVQNEKNSSFRMGLPKPVLFRYFAHTQKLPFYEYISQFFDE